jgi:predicted transcriptional regulator
MKSEGLLCLIAFSETRKEILVLLLDGPKSLTNIKDCLGVSSPVIIPRIKDLLAKNLICKSNGLYHITPIGISVITNFRLLINTLQVIENNEQYFNSHIINPLPQVFIDRIGMLGNCSILRNKLENINIAHEVLINNIINSKNILWITSIFHSEYTSVILRLAQQDIPISLIFTRKIYQAINKNYVVDFKKMLELENISVYVIDQEIKVSLIITDQQLFLSLAYLNGDFDYGNILSCSEKSALNWGESFFEYYKKHSKRIEWNNIMPNKLLEA